MTNTIYTKDYLKEKILNNSKWLERAIVAIYDKQTYDEKKIEETKYYNNIGFTGSDAKRLSYYAKWILSGKHLDGWHLETAKRRIVKYVGQLIKIIGGKI